LKRFFVRVTRYTLFGILILSIFSSAGGYFTPSGMAESKQTIVSNMVKRFNELKKKFESGEYREIMETVSKMGASGELDKNTMLYGASEFEMLGWKKVVERMSGTEELRAFVENDRSGAVEDEDATNKIPFPSVSLLGITFAGGGKEAVTVLDVNGAVEIWKWEKSEGKWTTDSIPFGYELKEADIAKDKITFSLYSIQSLSAVKTYEIENSIEGELEKYKPQ
jgi:hypothetical protein